MVADKKEDFLPPLPIAPKFISPLGVQTDKAA